MNPTTDKLIEKGCGKHYKQGILVNLCGSIDDLSNQDLLCQECKARLQGRLDVLEEWHTFYHQYMSCYHTNRHDCLLEKEASKMCKISSEIAKIKEVLK